MPHVGVLSSLLERAIQKGYNVIRVSSHSSSVKVLIWGVGGGVVIKSLLSKSATSCLSRSPKRWGLIVGAEIPRL